MVLKYTTSVYAASCWMKRIDLYDSKGMTDLYGSKVVRNCPWQVSGTTYSNHLQILQVMIHCMNGSYLLVCRTNHFSACRVLNISQNLHSVFCSVFLLIHKHLENWWFRFLYASFSTKYSANHIRKSWD